ncbi:MAG: tRNA (guanosine(37)-N1)-methyltransferase TrmD [Clostridiales bacterium]|nr:tRNA (guanosine(37)-N1)-methyltransferase TrmD [Clostridiales bacterium]HOC07918.1 tRNA (guanosine(37)-N1)-methyltransferase TrmD [Bacillota bacterium]HQD41687.1 tRNA (guanosine(37)-N1)-methyltransferase TrmD [Bacillota bacterium]
MKIDILTLFPEMFDAVLKSSILGKAIEKGILRVGVINIRDFSKDRHRRVDDYPYGGGAGMVMMPQPLYDAIKSVKDKSPDARVVLTSPRGKPFDQEKARLLSKEPHLVIVCGHYEGIDQRIIDTMVDEEISIGDYILTGGELPAMVIVDAVARLLPGAIGSPRSLEQESFTNGLLEYPQYTRPADFLGMKVPEVLLSGNHKRIEEWRRRKAVEITRRIRPDLLAGKGLEPEEPGH